MRFTGHDPSTPLPESWAGRPALTQALLKAADDFDANADRWENITVPTYLEALAALLAVIENSYANNEWDLPDDPWQVVADAVLGARYYE